MKITDKYTNRKKHTAKILQFGEGNFLRAFVDWMVDKTNKETGSDVGVTIVQPLSGGMIDMINDQDGLYTVVENGVKDGQVVETSVVVEAISGALNPYASYEAFLETARENSYEIVISNTTEAGIAFVDTDKFDDAPASSYPGKLTKWLYTRYKAFDGAVDKGVVVIPCELIEANGDKLKECILKYVDLWALESGFKSWIDESCAFCNTLVDRIVPGYPRHKLDELREKLGYEDQLIVETEPYHLWVIEADEAVQNRLPFSKELNIVYTESLFKYRTRKVRLLNGPHTCMVPVGLLYGVETVMEAVNDEVVGAFLNQAIHEEMIPVIDMDENELKTYAVDVMDRFRNPFVKHQLMSISLNSHSKYRTRVLPTLKEHVQKKQALPNHLVFSLAAMLRLFRGDINGQAVELKDDAKLLDMHKKLWAEVESNKITIKELVESFFALEDLWYENLNEIDGLTDLTASYLEAIHTKGMKAALEVL